MTIGSHKADEQLVVDFGRQSRRGLFAAVEVDVKFQRPVVARVEPKFVRYFGVDHDLIGRGQIVFVARGQVDKDNSSLMQMQQPQRSAFSECS